MLAGRLPAQPRGAVYLAAFLARDLPLIHRPSSLIVHGYQEDG